MLPQLRRLREYARVPLIAKPNAGMPQIVDGKAVDDCTPEEFVALIPDMLRAGVAVFGGCCGTTAAHLAALRDALDGASVTPPAPLHTDKLPAATEKQPFPLPVDVRWSTVISLTADAEDALSAGQETDDPVLAVRIDDWDGVQALADFQYLIAKPLCIVCDDGELLEAALRVYQGRALYDGGLPDSVLLPLRDKYGLLI